MKMLKYLQILCLVLLCSCDSCKEDELTSLPPETQTGANTFGCYVDGELFLANRKYAPFGRYYLISSYSLRYNALEVSAWGAGGEIGLYIIDPKVNEVKLISGTILNSDKLLFEDENVGEIYLTRFDTINKIVSGTFSCPIRLKYYIGEKPNDTIAIISQGRFDLKLEMDNN